MNPSRDTRPNWFRGSYPFLLLFLLSVRLGLAETTNVYTTGFESSEGYDTKWELIGQNHWEGYGGDSGGNGVFTNAPRSQAAYVGWAPIEPPSEFLTVWQPLPDVTGVFPLVKFSVLMTIEDSTNQEWDNFRWSAYDRAGDRLFTLDFDNYELGVYYKLSGTNDFVYTRVDYTNGVSYELEILMNFASNRWSASLSGKPFVTNLPISTMKAPLSLGDIDAAWVIYRTNAPGDNYMVFDDYRVTAETIATPAPVASLVPLGFIPNGPFILRLVSSSGARFAIDATRDWKQWTPLRTNTVTDGFFDFIDAQAASIPSRFYRGRYVP